MQEMQVWSLGWEDPLEKEMAKLLQYSCLENSIDRGAWRATVHGVSNSQTWPGTVQYIVTVQLRGLKPWTLAFLSLPPSSFSMTWVLPRPPSSVWIGNLPRYQHLCLVDLEFFWYRGIPGNSSQHPGVLAFRVFSWCWNLYRPAPRSLFCVWDWPTAHVAVISANLWPKMLSCSFSGFSISDAAAQLVYARASCNGERSHSMCPGKGWPTPSTCDTACFQAGI